TPSGPARTTSTRSSTGRRRPATPATAATEPKLLVDLVTLGDQIDEQLLSQGSCTTAIAPAARVTDPSTAAPVTRSVPFAGTSACSSVWFSRNRKPVPSSLLRRTASTPRGTCASGWTPDSASSASISAVVPASSCRVATYQAAPCPTVLRVIAGPPGNGPSVKLRTTSAVVVSIRSVHTSARVPSSRVTCSVASSGKNSSVRTPSRSRKAPG